MNNYFDWGLKDHAVVITGATGYLGRALAHGFGNVGSRLVLSARRQETLDLLSHEFEITSDKICTVAADLADPSAADLIIATAMEKLGGIDTLVINAGTLADALVAGLTDDDLEHVHDINLHAAFRLIRAALKTMIVRRSGSVIVVSSTAARRPGIGQAAYASSKAALEIIVRVAARETAGRGIRINGVAPGLLAGGMAKRVLDEAANLALAAVPMERFGIADDVVPTVLFLASPMSSYVTGQVWCIDGGLTA